MPQASTKSYLVDYVHVDTVAKIPELVTTLLGIKYNVDINAYREVTAPAQPEVRDEQGEVITPATPETFVDHYTFAISRNGINPVRINLGDAVVWDNGVLYGFTVEEFLTRYTIEAA